MIWNAIPDEEKLRLWKKLREDIANLNLEGQLNSVAEFFFKVPYGARTLDYYSPQDWPTPWEILFHGSFCTSSISLLMYHTLVMATGIDDVELFLIEDDDGVYLMPVIDNQFVLNYELGKVNRYSDVKDSFKVLQKYSKEQVKTIK